MKKFSILVAFVFSGVVFAIEPQNMPPPPAPPSPPPFMPIDGMVYLFIFIAMVYSFAVLKKLNLKKR